MAYFHLFFIGLMLAGSLCNAMNNQLSLELKEFFPETILQQFEVLNIGAEGTNLTGSKNAYDYYEGFESMLPFLPSARALDSAYLKKLSSFTQTIVPEENRALPQKSLIDPIDNEPYALLRNQECVQFSDDDLIDVGKDLDYLLCQQPLFDLYRDIIKKRGVAINHALRLQFNQAYDRVHDLQNGSLLKKIIYYRDFNKAKINKAQLRLDGIFAFHQLQLIDPLPGGIEKVALKKGIGILNGPDCAYFAREGIVTLEDSWALISLCKKKGIDIKKIEGIGCCDNNLQFFHLEDVVRAFPWVKCLWYEQNAITHFTESDIRVLKDLDNIRLYLKNNYLVKDEVERALPINPYSMCKRFIPPIIVGLGVIGVYFLIKNYIIIPSIEQDRSNYQEELPNKIAECVNHLLKEFDPACVRLAWSAMQHNKTILPDAFIPVMPAFGRAIEKITLSSPVLPLESIVTQVLSISHYITQFGKGVMNFHDRLYNKLVDFQVLCITCTTLFIACTSLFFTIQDSFNINLRLNIKGLYTQRARSDCDSHNVVIVRG